MSNIRHMCPPAYPVMCRLRDQYAVDYHCATDNIGCADLGGPRSCTWTGYDMTGFPAFERVVYNVSAPVTTHVLSRSFESELKIDSASRCGPAWTANSAHTHVAIVDGICDTGFACCAHPMSCDEWMRIRDSRHRQLSYVMQRLQTQERRDP